jgi:hypothetical protein
MDYRHALNTLRDQLDETPRFGELLPLETRLQENLRGETLYGSTETIRHERAQIVDGLNDLARSTLGITFNDLVFGRTAETGLGTSRIVQLRRELNVDPTPNAVSPPVQTKHQRLPFNELSWEQFELLCAALVAAQGDVVDCHLYGLRGEDQKGIDIVATHVRAERRETWVYQCKRYQVYSEVLLRKTLENLDYEADISVILLSIEAGTQLRNVVAERPNTFLWDARDLSRKLKGFPQLVDDFFGPAWRKSFICEAAPL